MGMDKKPGFNEFAFDSEECAAIAHDLAILQTAELDRSELNFSVEDLENIMKIARGEFSFGQKPKKKPR